MGDLEAELTRLGLVFVLVFARVGAAVTTAPVFSDPSLPLRVRALLALSLSVLLTPTLLATGAEAPRYLDTLVGLACAAAFEAMIGLALGLGLMVIVAGVQLTGQIVGQMSGMALAEGGTPVLGDTSSIFGQVYYLAVTAVFVAAGGHRVLIDGLLETFTVLPPGEPPDVAGVATSFLALMSISFEVGLRAAAPLLLALFMATIVLGLISRTLPQINTLVVGFGLNAMLTLAVMTGSIGMVAWTFQAPMAAWVDRLLESLTPV